MSGKRTWFVAALALLAVTAFSLPAQAEPYGGRGRVEYHHHYVPHYYGPRIVVTAPPVYVAPPAPR